MDASVRINWYVPESVDMFGPREAVERVFDIPFSFMEEVYYAYKKGRRWVLINTTIDIIGISNIPNIKLANGMWVDESHFDRLFKKDQLKEAQQYCIDKNTTDKIKIYRVAI